MEIQLNINKHFQPYLFDYDTKYLIFRGGSGSGKSYFITQRFILKCLTHKCKVLVLRKTNSSTRDSVIALFKDILEQMGISYSYNSTYQELRLNESIILFKGLDNPEKIKSIAGITDIWLEEATEFCKDDFTQLVLRLRTKGKLQFILSFNPIHKSNWVYKLFYDKQDENYYLNKDTSYKLDLSTWVHNKRNLSKDYIKDLLNLKKSNPTFYNIYALGEWGTLSKLVFNNNDYTIGSINKLPFHYNIIDGIDFGYNDPTAYISSYIWKDENTGELTLYCYDEWVKKHATDKMIIDAVKPKLNGRTLIGDCASPQQINELKLKGLYSIRPCTKGKDSVINGINQLKGIDNWVIHPKCKELIRELTFYAWKKDKNGTGYLNEIERGSGDNHANVLDALRYSLQADKQTIGIINLKNYKKGL
jgi:phage terminase large subunit